jgi:hypothetical protein
MRQLRRAAIAAAVAVTMVAAVAALAGCAAPAYTYAADTQDHAYFKVPSSWYQVPAESLAGAQEELLRQAPAGASGGAITWSRAYSATPDPGAVDLLTSAPVPIVYASVQQLRDSLRAGLSFNEMRDLLFPVTSAGRQEATAEGAKFKGFDLLGTSTVTTSDGIRGISEIYEYTFNGVPDTFDQTVLTNSATTKLYLLLVQCSQACFTKYVSQIKAVVESYTVRGS